MAPSDDKGGADKYNCLPLDKLQEECEMRGIVFDINEGEGDLINKLIESDNKPIDWADVYSDLICHTSLSYFEIHEMTIPAIQAIRSKLGKNISIKIGAPNLFGSSKDTTIQKNPGKPPKLSEFMSFANAFNGI